MKYTVWQNINHRHDDIKYTGYDYRGNILKKTLSNFFFTEKKRSGILQVIDNVLGSIVDHVKMIKKTYNWVLPKYYRDFN